MRSRTWDAGRWSATKELFSPSKLHVMGRSFPHVAILLRSRSHTFPCSRPDYLLDMWASLQLWQTGVGALDQWKLQWPLEALTPLARQCAAHLACSYANLRCAPPSALSLLSTVYLSLGPSLSPDPNPNPSSSPNPGVHVFDGDRNN